MRIVEYAKRQVDEDQYLGGCNSCGAIFLYKFSEGEVLSDPIGKIITILCPNKSCAHGASWARVQDVFIRGRKEKERL